MPILLGDGISKKVIEQTISRWNERKWKAEAAAGPDFFQFRDNHAGEPVQSHTRIGKQFTATQAAARLISRSVQGELAALPKAQRMYFWRLLTQRQYSIPNLPYTWEIETLVPKDIIAIQLISSFPGRTFDEKIGNARPVTSRFARLGKEILAKANAVAVKTRRQGVSNDTRATYSDVFLNASKLLGFADKSAFNLAESNKAIPTLKDYIKKRRAAIEDVRRAPVLADWEKSESREHFERMLAEKSRERDSLLKALEAQVRDVEGTLRILERLHKAA
ncbi:MAG TPA: hypothetical protein HA254_02160 [Candidatus Diapherotrites archaeon]|uniref:Uncharacterized protein n=1 Tax=Candidatus Iainarchaeum sp. TaxID=3101447 RepID=A0A7J4IX66_9ARCH|nr:hypothetical protein [Candidatus Diapherotrites archaeon]